MNSAKLIYGSAKPRIETPNPKGRTRGEDVAKFADNIGLPLLPWQKHLFNHALKLDTQGKWRHTEVIPIVARQQGKTHACRIRILAGLFIFGEETLVGTAQDRQLARHTFELVVETIRSVPELNKYVANVRYANGQEQLTLTTGQTYKIVAPTASAARGYSNDFILLDEGREQTDFDLWAAIRPTMDTRRNKTLYGPQLWLPSNAGHANSVLLLQKRQHALEVIAKKQAGPLAYMEWSAPENANVADLKTAWLPSNPALGHLFDVDAIEAAYKSLPEPVFRTERLCQFVDTMESWLPFNAWELLEDTLEIPEQAEPDTVIFGIDRSPSWDSVSIVAIAELEGRVVVEVVDHWDAGIGEDALLARLTQLITKWKPYTVAGDEFLLSETLTKIEKNLAQPVHRIRGMDVQRASSTLYQYIVNTKIAHRADPLLTSHVQAAARQEVGEGWRLSRRNSNRHIDAVMALAAAVHAHSVLDTSPLILPTRAKKLGARRI